MPPFTFNLCQNGNFFGSFHFGFSSCRHFVDSLRAHPKGWALIFYFPLFKILRRFRSLHGRISRPEARNRGKFVGIPSVSY